MRSSKQRRWKQTAVHFIWSSRRWGYGELNHPCWLTRARIKPSAPSPPPHNTFHCVMIWKSNSTIHIFTACPPCFLCSVKTKGTGSRGMCFVQVLHRNWGTACFSVSLIPITLPQWDCHMCCNAYWEKFTANQVKHEEMCFPWQPKA